MTKVFFENNKTNSIVGGNICGVKYSQAECTHLFLCYGQVFSLAMGNLYVVHHYLSYMPCDCLQIWPSHQGSSKLFHHLGLPYSSLLPNLQERWFKSYKVMRSYCSSTEFSAERFKNRHRGSRRPVPYISKAVKCFSMALNLLSGPRDALVKGKKEKNKTKQTQNLDK